jgi:hypothetical protein
MNNEGFLFGSLFGGDEKPSGFYPRAGAIYFSNKGAFAGFITSQLIAIDKTYLIQGRSPEALEAILDKLSKKARVRDFN